MPPWLKKITDVLRFPFRAMAMGRKGIAFIISPGAEWLFSHRKAVFFAVLSVTLPWRLLATTLLGAFHD